MANPFSGFLDRAREGRANRIDPSRPERMRADASSTAVLDVLARQAQSDPALLANPKLKTLIDLYQKDPKQAAQVLQNPALLQVVPEPAKPAAPSSKEGRLVQDLTGFAAGTPEFQAAVQERLKGSGESSFGASLKGRAFDLAGQLAPLAQAGQLSPEQQRDFDTALAVIQQPIAQRDPITQELTFTPPQIPAFLQPFISGASAGARPPQAVGAEGAPTAPNAAPGPEQPTITQPGDALLAALPSGSSLFEQAGNLTGPIDAAARMLSGVVGLGGFTGEEVGADLLAKQVTELLVDAMRVEREGSSRAVQEVEQLKKDFAFVSEPLGSEENMRERLVQTRLELERRESEILARLNSPGTTSGKQKQRDLDALVRIQSVKPRVSPPVLQTAQEIQEFMENSPPGSTAAVRDPDDPNRRWIFVGNGRAP